MLKWFFVLKFRGLFPAFLILKYVTVKATSLLNFWSSAAITQTVKTLQQVNYFFLKMSIHFNFRVVTGFLPVMSFSLFSLTEHVSVSSSVLSTK